jgi:hypothetical protein
MLLSSCSSLENRYDLKKESALKGNEGLIALRISSNSETKHYLYFDTPKSATQQFFSRSPKRFVSQGDKTLQLMAMPAGKYNWLSMHFSGNGSEGGVQFSKESTFKIIAGKINYIGDIETLIFKRRSMVLVKVKNNADNAKNEIIKKSPSLLSKYPLVISISKIVSHYE